MAFYCSSQDGVPHWPKLVNELCLSTLDPDLADTFQRGSTESVTANSVMAKQNSEQQGKPDRSAREVILGDCMATLLFMAASSIFDEVLAVVMF